MFLTLLALLLLGAFAWHGMEPRDRERLTERAYHLAERAIRAMRASPDAGAFYEFLRARTRYVIATPSLIALNVIVFVVMAAGEGAVSAPETLIAWGANFPTHTSNGEWWRLVSAVFVHAGILHLAATIAGLLLVGTIVERAVGPVALTAVYLGTGIFANVVSLWTVPALSVSTGASAAVFGVYGLLLAMVAWWIVHRSPVGLPVGDFKRLCAPAALFVIYNVITDHLNATSELAGVTAGLVAGLIVARGVAHARSPVRRAALVMAASVAMTVLAVLPVRGILDIRAEIEAVLAAEQRTAAAYDSAVVKFRKGALTTDALAQMIDKSIRPELRAIELRIKTLRGVPQEHTPLVAAAGEFLLLRDESWRHRSEALRASDTDMLRHADRAERAALEALQRVKRAG